MDFYTHYRDLSGTESQVSLVFKTSAPRKKKENEKARSADRALKGNAIIRRFSETLTFDCNVRTL